jgi:hypothetical protein
MCSLHCAAASVGILEQPELLLASTRRTAWSPIASWAAAELDSASIFAALHDAGIPH